LATHFAFSDPKPKIFSLQPSQALAGSADFVLKVNGSHFDATSVVNWNGSPRPTTQDSSTQLTATIFAADVSTAGTAQITVSNTNATSDPFLFTINPVPVAPLTITTSATLPDGLLNSAYSQSFGAAGGTPPYDWKNQSGNLPDGLNLTSDGTLSGTPTSAGTFLFTVRVRDSAQPQAAATKKLTLAIDNPVPAITGIKPSSAVAGGPDFILTVNGSNFVAGSTVQWNGSDRTTTFSSATKLTASITASDIQTGGTANVTVNNPSPGGGLSNAKQFTISSPLTIITKANLPDGLVNTGYTKTLSASGGTQPYNWTIASGSLPPGVSFNPSSGMLSGTPTSSGTFTFTVQVTDSASATTPKTFNLTVQNPVPAITGLNPKSVTAGGPGFTLTVNGSNFVSNSTIEWNGSDRATNFIGATKLTASISASDIASAQTVSVTVNNPSPGGGSSNASSLSVLTPPPPGLTITSPSPLPDGTLATAYSQTLLASGGTLPYQWSISSGTPPAGISLAPGTGVLSGTPSAGGDFSFTVKVSDSTRPTPGTAIKLLALRINNPAPFLSGLNPSSATVGGNAFTLTLTGSGFTATSSVTWNGSDRPTTFISNVRLTASISATDIASASAANVAVRNPSPGGGVSRVFLFVVSPPVSGPTITTSSPLPDAFAGLQYSQTLLASGGNPPYAWSVSGLPAGLTLNPSTGVISGTATAPGTFQLTIQLSDAQSSSAKSFQLLINPRLPTVSISGATDVVTPAQQPVIEVTLAEAYPIGLSGQMTLTFTPDADEPSDDPSIQFATGGRGVSFTVPANSLQAQFPNSSSSVAFQTGTVSGTIKMTVSLQSEGNDITPAPAPTRSFKVNRTAPTITRLSISSKSASGFEVEIVGYSTPRSLTQLSFTFTPHSGSNLGTTNLTVPLGTSSTTWFQSQTSKDFGSLFRLTIPFTVQGDVNVLQSASATLTNAEGSSDSASTSF
jgi:hypothetical protein